jgi:hypothetical protein
LFQFNLSWDAYFMHKRYLKKAQKQSQCYVFKWFKFKSTKQKLRTKDKALEIRYGKLRTSLVDLMHLWSYGTSKIVAL